MFKDLIDLLISQYWSFNSFSNLVFSLDRAEAKFPMLLTPLRKTHGERVSIFTDVCVASQTFLEFDDVLLETIWSHLVRKDCLSFLGRL